MPGNAPGREAYVSSNPVVLDPDRSTHELLADRGLTARHPKKPMPNGAREVVNDRGEVVFVGTSGQTLDWMRAGMPAAVS